MCTEGETSVSAVINSMKYANTFYDIAGALIS